MKLYYFKDPSGNFGDDLNPWLWRQLLPDILDDREDEIFVGIGTLLNHRLPMLPIKHVFGSGFGYGNPPHINEKYIFHAVRGYETAKALNLPTESVITDAAVLIRAVDYPKAKEKSFRFGFMPTGQTIRNYDWEVICRELGFCYISCHWDVERILFEMSRCETMICEAMHGAIVADAMRIPWIPVCCNNDILAFKWRDWLSSLDMPYLPTQITPLYDIERDFDVNTRLKNALKRSLRKSGFWSRNWTAPPPRNSGPAEKERAREELRVAALKSPFLSSDALIDSHTARYLDLIQRLRYARSVHR